MTNPRFVRRPPHYWRPDKKPKIKRTNWRTEHQKSFNWSYIFTLPKVKKIIRYGLLAVIILLVGGVMWLSWGLPDPNKLMSREVAESTKIYDRTGETILYEIHGDEKRTLVTLDKIPQHLRDATIAIEDKNFYTHKGFSLWAIFRTAVTNVFTNRRAGGSTLTQQFVKNAVLTSKKSYIRKLKEVIIAYRMEKKFSKDEILQMYFNEIPYGSNAYGVEAASLKYFGKHVEEVNLAEAAILAAMVQSPTRYSPYGTNKETLIARQQYVLDLMVDQDMISKEEAETAKQVKLTFRDPTDNFMAPHFVLHVKQLLVEKYGEKMVEQGGLKIYTTLDTYKQKIAEEVVKNKAEDNDKKFLARNAALVSIDPKNGQILALVGSKDYSNESIDGQVNVVLSPRQPGSSFKPIAYATAFIKGYTPNTVLYDVITNFSTTGQPYQPKNYNGQEYGPVSMKKALAGSLNIPAVKTLYLAGLDNTLEIAKKLGYTTLNDKDRLGLSLVLGGGEVSLLEHTNAYSAFARDGVMHDPNFILKIEDRSGKIIEEYKSDERRVFEANIARLINFCLSDNNERAYIFGARNFLTLGNRPVAVKTGTTNNNRDAWTIGYTPSLVTGVWVGNNNNTEMKAGADGSVVAAPIWNEYMRRVLGDDNIENFTAPKISTTGKAVLDGKDINQTKIKIDRASGLLATEYTPETFIEEKIFQEPHNILYYIDKNDPLGEAPKNPASDPQFNLWENAVQDWAKRNKIESSQAPTEKDNLHLPENKPVFSFSGLNNNQAITNTTLNIKLQASAPRGIARAEYYINNNLLETNLNYPFGLETNLNFLSAGYYELDIRVCDDIDNCSEQKINFNLKNNQTNNSTPSVILINPTNEQLVGPSDFPLLLKVNLKNTQNAAKLIFKITDASKQIKTVGPIKVSNQTTIETNWSTPLASGTYTIYAEITTWQGKTITSESTTIIVNNN